MVLNEWNSIFHFKISSFLRLFSNNLKERFDIYSTPVIYILDRDKKIKAKRLSADQVVDLLKNFDAFDK